MTQPPIFAAVEHDLQRGWHTLTQHIHHAHYHQPVTTATPATEAPMSLTSIVLAAKHDAETIDASVHNFLNEHLPALGELASQVENSTLLQTVLGLVGTIDPAAERVAVTMLKALAADAPAAIAAPAPQPEPAPEPVA